MQDAGLRAAAAGVGANREGGSRRYWGAQEGPANVLPVPPTPGPALQGELGVSPAGGEPTGPQQACTPLGGGSAGGGAGGGFPNTGLSLLPSLLLLLLLPVPAPPRPAPRSCWRFAQGCGAGAPSILITKQNYFKVPCLPGAGVGGK